LASRFALLFRAVNPLRQLDGVSPGLSSLRGFLRSRSRRKSGSSSGATGRGAGRGPDPLRRPTVSQATGPTMGTIKMIRIHAARGSLRTSRLAVWAQSTRAQTPRITGTAYNRMRTTKPV
jgi:hypothetical protein